MIGYTPPQYCNIVAKDCNLDVCCYECTKEICEYRCHLCDHKDYTKCKHAEKSKISLD